MNRADKHEADSIPDAAMAVEISAKVKGRGPAALFVRNSLLNVGRLVISTAIGFILPSFLIHKLPVTTYSAWVLILQMSAYVGYLDFGIQMGIAKYVAEYDAKDDAAGLSRRASAGLALLTIVSSLGVILSLVLAWQAPALFREMPRSLYRDVRIGLVLVGFSTSFNLLCAVFGAIFTGLQQFEVPTILSLVNRVLFTVAILAAVFLHKSLVTMGALVALVNIATGALQFAAWRKFASRVRISLRNFDIAIVKEMLAYCSGIAVWTMAMLLISGLDVTLVGRYDFRQTAFYSIATAPTNFMIGIMSAAVAPLMPSTSALSIQRTSTQMGRLLERAMRYSTDLLVVSGLPLLVAGYWVLRFWVGVNYAPQILGYLRILVIANIIRNTCAPYAIMLAATNRQKVGLVSGIAEALVNLASSIYLARHIGAIGVAYGTLLGALVGVGMHFALSMHYTYAKFSVTRTRLFLTGIGRPLLIAVPSLLLLPMWWLAGAPHFGIATWLGWGMSTALMLWFGALDPGERIQLLRRMRRTADFRQATATPAEPT